MALAATALYFRSAVAMVMRFEYCEWKASHDVRLALENPRSVMVTEFAGDAVIAQVTCTSQHVSALRDATNRYFRPFIPRIPLCFEPHHRIEIVRADGSTMQLYVCFLCGNFSFDDNPAIMVLDVPPYWTAPLNAFFTNIGMTPKTLEEYRVLEVNAGHRD
jgi:hypothetical protein